VSSGDGAGEGAGANPRQYGWLQRTSTRRARGLAVKKGKGGDKGRDRQAEREGSRDVLNSPTQPKMQLRGSKASCVTGALDWTQKIHAAPP